MTLKDKIRNLHAFFKREDFYKHNHEKKSYLDKIAKASNVSLSTVYRALKGEHTVKPPTKRRNVKIDSFDVDVIRHVIYGFYEKNELPTRRMISNALTERGILVSTRQLERVLPRIGFKWKKVSENRKVFIERIFTKNSRISTQFSPYYMTWRMTSTQWLPDSVFG